MDALLAVVRKKNDKPRVCDDFSAGLNDAIELNRHSIHMRGKWLQRPDARRYPLASSTWRKFFVYITVDRQIFTPMLDGWHLAKKRLFSFAKREERC